MKVVFTWLELSLISVKYQATWVFHQVATQTALALEVEWVTGGLKILWGWNAARWSQQKEFQAVFSVS